MGDTKAGAPAGQPPRPPYKCQRTPIEGECIRFDWNEHDQAYNLPIGGTPVPCTQCLYFFDD